MPVHEYLKGYLACMDISFTLREMFFLYFARSPASYNFANDPSLSILYCLVAVKCQFFWSKRAILWRTSCRLKARETKDWSYHLSKRRRVFIENTVFIRLSAKAPALQAGIFNISTQLEVLLRDSVKTFFFWIFQKKFNERLKFYFGTTETSSRFVQ